jgi:hypothetical protein
LNTNPINTSVATFGTTPPGKLDSGFLSSTTRETSQDNQIYDSYFSEAFPILQEEDQESRNRERLEAAEKAVDPRFHLGLRLMLRYQRNNDDCPDLVRIAPAVQAGYAAINQGLQEFTENLLRKWMTKGLHPLQSHVQDISEQCYLDLRYLGIGLDTETEVMVRRVARIRLYYWYEEQNKVAQRDRDSLGLGRGKDTRSKAIDTLLEEAYDDWKMANEHSRKARRNEFHYHKDIGRKWCELVSYLGAGILVICGKEMDTKL